MQKIHQDERYYHGVLYLEKGKWGILPRRYTDTQLKHYEINPLRLICAMCTSGVSLQMETDATWLQLDMQVTGVVRQCAPLTAVVDGVRQPMVNSVVDSDQGGAVSVRFELDGGLHRVEIYLPSMQRVEITDLTWPEETSVMQPVEKKKGLYMAFGDSITQGTGCVDPYQIYPVQLAKAFDMELLSLGVAGGTYIPALVEDLGLDPDLITVALGTNDRMMVDTIGQFELNVEGMLSNLERQYPRARCVVITPPWDERQRQGKCADMAEEIRVVIRRVVKNHPRIRLLEGFAMVPRGSVFFADEAHPNDRGQQEYTDNLLRLLV